jgi:hypothetical protein
MGKMKSFEFSSRELPPFIIENLIGKLSTSRWFSKQKFFGMELKKIMVRQK